MMRDHADTRYFTIAQVSDQLHLSRSKVYDLMAREGLPVVRFGRAVRVSVVALQQWIDQREQQTRPEGDREPQRWLGSDQHHHKRLRAAGSRISPAPRGQAPTPVVASLLPPAQAQLQKGTD